MQQHEYPPRAHLLPYLTHCQPTRRMRRFYVLTNTGGFFFAKGFAEFDSLKPLLTLTGSSEVSLERGGSGRREEAAHACMPRAHVRFSSARSVRYCNCRDEFFLHHPTCFRVRQDIAALVYGLVGVDAQ